MDPCRWPHDRGLFELPPRPRRRQGPELEPRARELDGQTEVKADEEAIRQIFDNLVDNAIKYTPEGGSVRVSCRQTGEAIVVEVADSGIEIPRDELSRVFERFYRVDKARSRELGGTGLGLSIVKHLVQSLDGQVSVVSRSGREAASPCNFLGSDRTICRPDRNYEPIDAAESETPSHNLHTRSLNSSGWGRSIR